MGINFYCLQYINTIIMQGTSSGKHNVMVWRPSVCPIGILTVTHQGAACDAASVHFGPSTRRTDILGWLYIKKGK